MNKYNQDIPDRTFMRALLKHTGIALAILVPLAAYTTLTHAETGSLATSSEPKAYAPTSVAEVDLNKYAGQWYEIARLPMFFQRQCASDVTATYKLNKDNEGNINSVDVTNECRQDDGEMTRAVGLAKPVNDSGSQLKVTFLPSWIRWLPVGKANYWVLQLDENYNSALVGTPDNKYLWMLSRKPTLSKTTFDKYKNLAQKQGYDISNLKITTHNNTPHTIIN